MKVKSLIVFGALAVVLTLSGCGATKGNELTCSITEDEGKSVYTFNFDDKDVLKDVTVSIEFQNEQYAQIMYALISTDETANAKIDGKKVTYVESADSFKESIEIEEVTKDKVKEAVVADGFTCK